MLWGMGLGIHLVGLATVGTGEDIVKVYLKDPGEYAGFLEEEAMSIDTT